MAPPSLFARVLAAGGALTVNASAGGEINSILAGLAGSGNEIEGVPDNRRAFSFLANRLVHRASDFSMVQFFISRQPSRIATALVQPAEARSIFTGKHDTMNPVDGSCSRLCSFSMWQ